MPKARAGLQPAQRLPFALLRALPQVLAAVAVHVDLADIARHTRTLQLLHENDRRVRMEGGEHTDPRRAAGDQIAGKAAVDAPRVIRVGKARFRFERIGIEPIHQRQIHSEPQHRILRCVQVHIDKGGHNQRVAPVRHLRVDTLRRGRQHILNRAALVQQQRAVPKRHQLAEAGGIHEIPFHKFHKISSLICCFLMYFITPISGLQEAGCLTELIFTRFSRRYGFERRQGTSVCHAGRPEPV